MSPPWMFLLANVLLPLAVGRLCLSFLPAGQPGSLAPHERYATLGASYLLGTCALKLETHVLGLFGQGHGLWMLVLPWILLAFVRWATLPGAMVPRHEPRAQTPGALARALSCSAPAVVLVGPFVFDRVDGDAALDAALCVCALLAIIDHALRWTRRAPLGRAAVSLLLALSLVALLMSVIRPGLRSPLAAATLCIGSGAAFSVCWLRRADRRAALLAQLAFSGAALFDERTLPLAIGGLLALCIHTARPARRFIVATSCVLAAVVGVIARSQGPGSIAITAFENARWSNTPLAYGAGGAIVLALALAFVHVRRSSHVTDSAPAELPFAPDPPSRERSALRSALIAGLMATLAAESWGPASTLRVALLPLLPIMFLIAGLALTPAERPLAQA